MTIPAELLYTKDHEWVRIDGKDATVGITEFAQGELGDIVFVDIPTVGSEVASNEVFGSVEAVKTVSDLFMPLSGKVSALNPILENAPEKVNQDPYGEGWIIKMEVSDLEGKDELLSADQYKSLIGH